MRVKTSVTIDERVLRAIDKVATRTRSVYMKISSDTKTVSFYYSLDKQSWQLIRLFKIDYPGSIWVGISTQWPLGEGTSAVFEDVSLTKQSISDFRLGI